MELWQKITMYIWQHTHCYFRGTWYLGYKQQLYLQKEKRILVKDYAQQGKRKTLQKQSSCCSCFTTDFSKDTIHFLNIVQNHNKWIDESSSIVNFRYTQWLIFKSLKNICNNIWMLFIFSNSLLYYASQNWFGPHSPLSFSVSNIALSLSDNVLACLE